MNISKNVIAILSMVLILSIAAIAITFVLDDGSLAKGDVTKIAAPEQTEPLVPEWSASLSQVKLEDLGTNLAKGNLASADTVNSAFLAKLATDGNVETYWEGQAKAFPAALSVDLGTAAKVGKVRLRLNPDPIWAKRVQNIAVLGSTDGSSFTELVPAQDYNYDPKTGNLVVIDIPSPVDVKVVKVVISSNTGATGAQVSELEVFAAK